VKKQDKIAKLIDGTRREADLFIRSLNDELPKRASLSQIIHVLGKLAPAERQVDQVVIDLGGGSRIIRDVVGVPRTRIEKRTKVSGEKKKQRDEPAKSHKASPTSQIARPERQPLSPPEKTKSGPLFLPSLEQIRKLKVKPEAGEIHLLNFLNGVLDNTYEVYFQPFLNGDNPDIVIMRRGSGVMIIEVKDWHLTNYYIDERGRWRLGSNSVPIKSPLAQVSSYKDNLYYLHIDKLMERKIQNPKVFAIVSRVVYFHNETESSAVQFCRGDPKLDKYIQILGHDSLSPERFAQVLALDEVWLSRPSYFFDSGLYDSFKRYLQPPTHTVEQGIPINYTKKQVQLIKSEPREQKILGVAGSGKTTVLAKRAVNAHLRTRSSVLILTYNITLRNYIHDKISEVRESFSWKNFHIINYHWFFKMEANNHNLPYDDNAFLAACDDEDFFESVKDKIFRYDAVFIDEAQDYKSEWIRIIRKYFLANGGELVVYGDAKQNVYRMQMGDDKRPNTGIPGRWNEINESFRLAKKIVRLALDFQQRFLSKWYDLDQIEISSQRSLFDVQESISYTFFAEGTNIKEIYQKIDSRIKQLDIHPNDVAILAPTIACLRELDFLIRSIMHEKTTVMFESKEVWEKLQEELSGDRLNWEVDRVRRGKKFGFWGNRGTMKLSTIHSFKGWEVDTLFIVIATDSTEELVYTGITRCRTNLVIINVGNQKYHQFFTSYL